MDRRSRPRSFDDTWYKNQSLIQASAQSCWYDSTRHLFRAISAPYPLNINRRSNRSGRGNGSRRRCVRHALHRDRMARYPSDEFQPICSKCCGRQHRSSICRRSHPGASTHDLCDVIAVGDDPAAVVACRCLPNATNRLSSRLVSCVQCLCSQIDIVCLVSDRGA